MDDLVFNGVNLEIRFVFEDYLKKTDGDLFIFNESFNDVRGLSVPSVNRIFINLSAEQWKDIVFFDELVDEISTTITHEIGHFMVYENAKNDNFTPDGEERTCQLFAGQIPEFNF